MNPVKKAAVSTKDFVVRHKTAVAVAATATVLTIINQKAIGQHNEFLKEHGLYDEFYFAPEED